MWPSHRFWRKRPAPELQDGFGQSLLEDAKFAVRFRRARSSPIQWRAPSREESICYDTHPVWGRFGDSTIAIAETGGLTWIIRERDWFGWPDPPRFVFIALETGGNVWAAWDFHHWPRAWASIKK